MNSMKKWMMENFDETQAVSILKELIGFDSENRPGKTEAEAAAWIYRLLNDNGIEACLKEAAPDRPNVYAVLKGKEKGKGKGPSIIFNGHIDVVPAGDGWTFPPFHSTLKDGKIYGRGAADMKAGVAAMIQAALLLKKAGCPFHGELHLFFNVDEEVTNQGMKQFLDDSLTADYALISEPTGMDITIGHRGVARFHVKTKGTPGHSAFVRQPDNAIVKMRAFLTALENLSDVIKERKDQTLGAALLNITQINGGTAANVIPEECTVVLDRRLLPGEQEEEVKGEIVQSLSKVQEETGFSFELKTDSFLPASQISEGHPFVKALERVSQQVNTEPISIKVFGATCEAPFFAVHKQIPTIVCGPGELEQAHVKDEFVEKEQYIRAVHTFTNLVPHLCKRFEQGGMTCHEPN